MTLRRNFVFQSSAFNTSESKPYFINEGCFGDDLARWLIERLKARGIEVEPEPGQEDFGWYVTFRLSEVRYNLVIGYRGGEGNEPGDWMCSLERAVGILGMLFGRLRKVEPAALEALHAIFSTAPEISNLRWFTDKDYGREENGQLAPTGR